MNQRVKIAPSILSADFSKLGKEISDLDKTNCDYIHIDVMDGHFVPNLTIGPDVIKSIRHFTKKKFDVHLMIDPVKKYIPEFANAGSDIITIHQEINEDVMDTICLIKKLNKKVGISIKPKTSAKLLEKYLDHIDLILVMTVEPGFGGQSFMHNQLQKISTVKKMIGNRKVELEVDGGINLDTGREAINAGANVLVSGSTIFNSKKYKNIIDDLRKL